MPILSRCFLLFLILFAAPLQAATGDSAWFYRGSDIPPDPAWQFGTLPNGLRYAIRRNALPAGQVSIRVRIDAGSLNEADNERGWAHFIEHMVFRGTRSFGDREARHIWEELGASFGSDSNATTSSTQTVYQLDLPKSDRASLERSMAVLSEMVDSATFDPAKVEAERKVVLAEKGRRSEIAVRYDALSRPLFYTGLKYADRDTIGTDETLNAATAEGLRTFYERWYRPERATIVMTGDADPALMAELIAKHFGGWKPSGPAPSDPELGAIARPKQRVAALAYPGAPYGAEIMWLRPHVAAPDTVERQGIELAERLAAQILNRRLEAKARGESSFISAGAGVGRSRGIADRTQLSITPKNGRWREALAEAFAIVADALRAPPSQTEIDRELSNLRTALASAVAGDPTIRSPQRAQQLVSALDTGAVIATPQTLAALLEKLGPQMTPERIAAATKDLFTGSGPRLLMMGPEPIPGGLAAIEAALAAAERAAPAPRMAERSVSFDLLPPLGSVGKEVSRHRIEDMDVTIVRFANGSTLTFKQTDFDKGQVAVRLRFGNGLAGIAPNRPSLAWTSGIVAMSGLADLDLDAMERLMTGRRMNINFGVGEDAAVLSGSTNAADLPGQLRLLVTKLAYPRWDPPLFNRFKDSWLENYNISFTSASARARRELGAVLHPGDQRWVPVERETIAAAKPQDVQSFFAPILAQGPIEAVIVGDVDLETVVAAAARTIGALPVRPAPPEPAPTVRPPAPNPQPVRFTHSGDPNQAYALIGWSTFGGKERIKQRRALEMAANMLRVRLFDRLREEEGATYSPVASSDGSEAFPDWGVFTAAAEVKPESVDSFFRIAREEIADLAAKPAAADEFARAQNPILSGIERTLKTNGYWVLALENWAEDPELIEQTRNYLSDYKSMTAEDVRAAVAAHVADEGDWSMLVLPDLNKRNGD